LSVGNIFLFKIFISPILGIWQEDVMEDIRKMKVRNWKETFKDRRTWRDLAEKAKTNRGLYCQMMMMNIGLCRLEIPQHVTLQRFESLWYCGSFTHSH